MKKMLVLGGVIGALAVPVSSAAASHVDGSYCGSFTAAGSCSATWAADVNGEYGGLTSGSWTVQQQVTVAGVTSWHTIAEGGPGEFSSPLGGLTAGNIYQLVITGSGGGQIGSVTGTGTLP